MVLLKTGLFSPQMLDTEKVRKATEGNSSVDIHGVSMQVEGVYTSLPGSVLNGGRINSYHVDGDLVYKRDRGECTDELVGSVEEITDRFIESIGVWNEAGFFVDLALTNHFVEESDLEDPMLRRTLDYLADQNRNEGMSNGVVYLNDNLRSFLNFEYRDLKLTTSIIKFFHEPDFSYEDGLNEADSIVLMRNDRTNNSVLESIPEDRRKDVYIIVNTDCTCTPAIADMHYRAMSKVNRKESEEMPRCMDHSTNKMTGMLPYEDLMKLVNLGYTSMKLGRYRIFEDNQVVQETNL